MRGGSRGRGRGGRGGFNRIMRDQTQETPAIYKPRENFPVQPIDMPKPPKISSSEKEITELFCNFREQMRNGPIYSVLETELQIPKPGELSGSKTEKPVIRPKAQIESPFESMGLYSLRDRAPKLPVPDLKGRTYAKEFFPPELHNRIGIRTRKSPTDVKARIKIEDEDEDVNAFDEEEEEDIMASEEDESFEEDEEDENDDYNAEQYFDNGDDYGMDDEGGGGDYE